MQKTLEKLSNGEHVTIVALGDSITEVTFHTQGRMNWVQLLDEAIFEEYGNGICTIINSGKCGSTYTDGLSRLERDVLRYNPDLVIIAFGMNDSTRGSEGLNQFKSDLEQTVNLIRQRCGSEIMLRTPNPVVTTNGLTMPLEQSDPGRAYESSGHPVKTYAAAIVEMAAKLGCVCVDHYTLWTEKVFKFKHPVANPCALWPRMSDAIHPGYTGHLAFFRELAPYFKVSEYFPWEELENK